jgi:hypothetical protein
MEVTKNKEQEAQGQEGKKPGLTHYLGYAKGEAPKQEGGQRRPNHRNGSNIGEEILIFSPGST